MFYCMVCAFASVAGDTDDAPENYTYAQWYALAAEAFTAQDFAAMRDAVDGALQLRPDFPPMLFYRAMASSKLDDADAAFEALEKLALMRTVPVQPEPDTFANIAADPRFRALQHRLIRISKQPFGRASIAYKLNEPGFLPEGIAYDDKTGALYLGSVRKAHIVRIVPPGVVDSTIIGPDLGSVFGMRIDAKRNQLWIASGVVPELDEAHRPESDAASIMVYSIGDRIRLAGRYQLHDKQSHLFGDLIIDDNGNIITTDRIGGGVYKLNPETRKFKNLVAPGVLYSPQGLAFAGDERGLYIADYRRGLYLFDTKNNSHKRYTTLDDASLYGIDGLYRHGDSLIAIQNGIKPHRVVQIPLDSEGKPVSPVNILAMNLEGMDEPTLGSLGGNRFYFVANSQWHRFADPDNPPKAEELTGPRIMSVDLDPAQ